MTSAKQSRHIPTTLYLDTEVFIRNGYHFEGKLSELKDTFIEKGLRLLVPEIMEWFWEGG